MTFFFLSACFLDADVYVVLRLLCIRDSVLIVEEPAESASKYRVKLCRTAVLSLSYRTSSITTTRSRHTCNAQRVVSDIDSWYTGGTEGRYINMSQHCVGRYFLGELKNKCSPTKQKPCNYREINFHLAK